MGVPNGTAADWRGAPIGWLWLSGRWSRLIILPLGGDMLTSKSCPFLLHAVFPQLFLLPVSTSSPPSASCSCLLLSSSSSAIFFCLQVSWTQATIVWQITDFIQMTVGGSNNSVLPILHDKDKDGQCQPGLYVWISIHRDTRDWYLPTVMVKMNEWTEKCRPGLIEWWVTISDISGVSFSQPNYKMMVQCLFVFWLDVTSTCCKILFGQTDNVNASCNELKKKISAMVKQHLCFVSRCSMFFNDLVRN